MIRQNRIFVSLVLLCAVVLLTNSANATKSLTLSCSIPLLSPLGQNTQNLYREALRPFGYRVNFIYATPTEELSMLAQQRVDGSCGRARAIKQLTNTLDHTLQVEVPSVNASYYEVVLKQPNPRLSESSDVRTAIIQNNRVLESLLLNDANTQLVYIPNRARALQLLRNGDVDRAILIDMDTQSTGQRLQDNPDLRLTHFYSMPVHALLLKQHREAYELLNRRLPVLLPKLRERREPQQHTPDKHFDKTLDMVCHVPLNSKIARDTINLYSRALEKLNFNLSVRHVSRLRATEELKLGRADLDCGRIEYFQTIVGDQAIRIPVPISEVSLHVYGLSPDRKINDFSHFEATDRVVYVQGSQMVADHLHKMGVQTQAVANPTNALKLLNSGSVDYYVGFHEETRSSIRHGLFSDRIHNLGQLGHKPLYSFLHVKHRGLRQKLEHVLRKTKQELAAEVPAQRP